MDGLVHGDPVQVGMDELAGQGIVLEILDDGDARLLDPFHAEVDQGGAGLGSVEDGFQVPWIELEGDRRLVPAVQHSGNELAPGKFA